MGASTRFRCTFPFVTAAMEQWRETFNNSREPALSFMSNSDHGLEVFEFDIDVGPEFEYVT